MLRDFWIHLLIISANFINTLPERARVMWWLRISCLSNINSANRDNRDDFPGVADAFPQVWFCFFFFFFIWRLQSVYLCQRRSLWCKQLILRVNTVKEVSLCPKSVIILSMLIINCVATLLKRSSKFGRSLPKKYEYNWKLGGSCWQPFNGARYPFQHETTVKHGAEKVLTTNYWRTIEKCSGASLLQ